jgi:AcrR family transcriptional regulator
MPRIQAPTIVAHRELRRQQLIAAAMELAMAGGADAVTVSAVAQKAGLARSSIYEYFSSSADLIADLVVEELDYYTERLAHAIQGATDPFEKIELWIAEGLRYVEDGRHMLVKSLNTVSTPEYRKEEIALGHRRLISPLREALTQTGIEDPKNLASAAAFLQSVTDAASKRIDAGNDAELEIQNAVTFALAGLRALAC